MKEDNSCQDYLQEDQPLKKEYAGNVILHISDLHFVNHTKQSKIIQRNLLAQELIEKVKSFPSEWQPNIVCITGDISEKNITGGYDQVKLFIETLLSNLNISISNLLICPGNHDVDKKIAQKYSIPQNAIEANEYFDIPIQNLFDSIFHKYICFCKKLGMLPYVYGDYSSYLFGIRKISNINFLICNSCWFFKDKYSNIKKVSLWFKGCITKKDYITNKLYIGLPLLRYLKQYHHLTSHNLATDSLVISLIHHPQPALSIDEINKYPTTLDPPAGNLLSNLSHLVLLGDSHTLPMGTTSFCTTDALNCGATFHESKSINSFCLIRIDNDRFLYRFCRLDPLLDNNRWIDDISGKFIIKNKLSFIHEYIDNGHSLDSLRDSDSVDDKRIISKPKISADILPSADELNVVSMQNTEIESSKLQLNDTSDIPKGDLKTKIDDIIYMIEKAELYISKFQYLEAFSIADTLANKVELLCSLHGEVISDIYSRLGLIEGTRASWLHEKKGEPEDLTLASDYLERAKNARRKP